jgi:hypothetical protein
MKYLIVTLAVLLCCCSPYFTPDPRPVDLSKDLLLQIECRNSQQAETSVIQTLKLVRYNDFEKQDHGTLLIIKARYAELPGDKAIFLIDQLKAISGVLDVQIIRDGLPVKNIIAFHN